MIMSTLKDVKIPIPEVQDPSFLTVSAHGGTALAEENSVERVEIVEESMF